MLGAVMFAHREIQPVIAAIIKLAEQAAKEPWELATNAGKDEIKKKLKGSIGKDVDAAYKLTAKQERQPRSTRRARRRPRRSPNPTRRSSSSPASWSSRRGRNRPRRDPQGRPPHRRPRHQDRSPDRIIVGFLPRTHGSALFTRGETQSIVSTTSAPRIPSK